MIGAPGASSDMRLVLMMRLLQLWRVAVIFQHVVLIPRQRERCRRRSGAKVQIGCNDLQGADLSRRLLHGSVLKPSPIDPVSMGTTS
jgi:hypothetical protein